MKRTSPNRYDNTTQTWSGASSGNPRYSIRSESFKRQEFHSRLAHMPLLRVLMAVVVFAGITAAQDHVSFPTLDLWTIHGDLYGTGDRGVVLVHGGRFEKGSWEPQARALEKAGFRA